LPPVEREPIAVLARVHVGRLKGGRIVHLQEASRRIERRMRRIKAGDSEKRLARVRVDVFHRLIGHKGRVRQVFRPFKDIRGVRPPRWLDGDLPPPVLVFRHRIRNRRLHPTGIHLRGIMLPHPLDIGIIIATRLIGEDQLVKAVGGVHVAMVAVAVVQKMQLADVRGVIAIEAQHLLHREHILRHLNAVPDRAHGGRIQPAQHALPAGHAHGSVHETAVQERPTLREAIQVRRVNGRIQQADGIPALLIRIDEQDVRSLHWAPLRSSGARLSRWPQVPRRPCPVQGASGCHHALPRLARPRLAAVSCSDQPR